MAHRYLHLSDGITLTGEAFGFTGESIGEVVFSTGMTGYCQSLTDPSFAGQILTFTYPIVGNYGVPKPEYQAKHLMANFESEKIWVKGVVISSLSCIGSHHTSVQSFSDWLTHEKIPGITGIDTRTLTRKLREHGVMNGVISISKSHPGVIPSGQQQVVREVSIQQPITYTPTTKNGKHLVLLDCGVKHGIIRNLLEHGYTLTRIPYDANPLDIQQIDGVIGSNGPGDPKVCERTIATIKRVVDQDVPYTGICLGHQLLSLAIGADTYKLSYGHRGINQPVQDRTTEKIYITSQNHGYAVKPETIPKGYTQWFTNLNDGTNEGIVNEKKHIHTSQFHPEGCPGPFDTKWILNLI